MQIRKLAVRKFFDLLGIKFHYAILVADRSEAGRRPVADLLARCQRAYIGRDRPNSSSLQVCNLWAYL